MGTRFKNTIDMFRQLPKVAERARAFVGKAARVPTNKYDPKRPLPAYIGRVFVAPAVNAGDWDDMFADMARDMLCSYLMATDGDRLHVALVATKDVPDDAQPYVPGLRFIEAIETAAAAEMRTAVLDARYLREAIGEDARYVGIFLPRKTGEGVVVTGISAKGGQVSWAYIMPVTYTPVGCAPKLAIPKSSAEG